MNKTTVKFEEEIERHGNLIYQNTGDSMMPLLRQGKDLMVVTRKPDTRLKRYDVPLYKRDSGQYVLHRILKVREQDYVICGDNRWQKEYGITDRHIIGVLAAVIRNGKSIPVTNWKYRVYVHVWCDLFPVRAGVLWLHALPGRIKGKMKR